MKPTLTTLLIGLIGLLAPSAQAANLNWSGTTSVNWSEANWTGGTPVSSGTDALTFAGSNNLSNTNNLTDYTASSITFASGAGAFILGGSAITLSGNVTNSDGDNQTISLGLELTAGNHTFATTSGHISVNGTISGDGGIRKTGTGPTLFLTGTNNSYTGVTEINGGPLSVTKLANGGTNSSIGASSNAAANLLLPNGSSTLTYAGTGDSTDRLFTAGSGSGFIRANGTGALNFTNTGAIAYDTVDQVRGLTLGGTNTGDNTFAPLLGDNGTGVFNLTKAENGKWILTNANTFSGITLMSRGILQLNNGLALQNSTLDATNSRTGDASHGISLTSPTALTLGGLTGTKDLSTLFTTSNGYSNLTALTLNPGAAKSETYSGGISDGATGMTLTKTGAGNQTLSGTNTYTGLTTISAGTLILASSGSIANTTGVNLGTTGSPGTLDVTAKSSYAFGVSQTVSGVGTINIGTGKTVTIDGNLNPGNSAGIVNVTGALTLNGTVTMEVNGMTGPGTNFDQVVITELLTYGGNFVLSFDSLQSAGTINLFDAATYTGDFANVTAVGSYGALTFDQTGDLWSAEGSGQILTFDQLSGDLNVAAIPEPSTLALLGLLGGIAMMRRTRVRRA